ncbi:probable RNA polymerase II nuclear localization protein SLC7A6OS [Schistocerca piceifrons]|uniref:probable RNA polymerase II nuclear localization protein SLC7A6OS n=1 Tax=Schistocerca piceifrons TaxID=274613 RepID=UPI001F5EF638|nr:probable RNA polymerase II nuclear localization protein SLC7A6OS [Schistocerca piceifrons]
MAAILRVKRRCDEDPHEALLLSCKRLKHDETPESNSHSYTALLQFAGTINTQEENVAQHILKKSKKSIPRTSKKHVTNILEKLRAESKQISQENRFKVVNCFRALNTADTDDEKSPPTEAAGSGEKEGSQMITVVDIEKSPPERNKDHTTPSEITNPSSEDKNYVYDLYYTEKIDFDDMLLDTQLSIHPMESELVYDVDEEDDKSQLEEEDSDSNDENNWRNDYPDSDNSINEDDMMLAMQMDDMNIDNELSSDDGEEDYIYSKEADPKDIRLYGSSYARYKRRMMAELDEADSDDSNSS